LKLGALARVGRATSGSGCRAVVGPLGRGIRGFGAVAGVVVMLEPVDEEIGGAGWFRDGVGRHGA
jgi:mevalonate pyrophosphate decarboxylase